jgi:glycosyltransferase involved in cell wall biosynthesis
MRDFAAEVTPVILTRDEEANIGRTLAQLAWAREVVIVDSLSTDDTVKLARGFPNVRVVEHAFDNLASQWNFGLTETRTRWVLALDADYFISDAFAAELRGLDPAPNVAGYMAAFDYAIHGRRLRGSLYPPRPVLLRRDVCTYWMDGHTQRLRFDGETGTLREHVVHDDRKPFRRFVQRQRVYMRAEAEKIRRSENLNLAGRIRKLRVVAPFAVLVHTLFVKGVILDGIPGLRYTFERVVAEVMLSIELMRRGGRPRPPARREPR